MKQYVFENNKLTLIVKRSPLLVRIVLFFLSFLFFLAPFLGMALSLMLGGRFHFGFLIGIVVFGLVGFYMLRNSLWNTYGKEVIFFNNNNAHFEADYGWFKDAKKTINVDTIDFDIITAGYEDDNLGNLIIVGVETEIISVVKIPKKQLEELIKLLKREIIF